MGDDWAMPNLTDEARIIVPSQLIGAATAARLLGLERSSLTRKVQAGKITALARLDGGAYVFDRAELLAEAEQ